MHANDTCTDVYQFLKINERPWCVSRSTDQVTWTECSVCQAQSPHCSNTHYPGLHRDNLSSLYRTRALKAFISQSFISPSTRGVKMYDSDGNGSLSAVFAGLSTENKCTAETIASNITTHSLLILCTVNFSMAQEKYRDHHNEHWSILLSDTKTTLRSLNEKKRSASDDSSLLIQMVPHQQQPQT